MIRWLRRLLDNGERAEHKKVMERADQAMTEAERELARARAARLRFQTRVELRRRSE
jgi:Xaa-Pro aminopeptidase